MVPTICRSVDDYLRCMQLLSKYKMAHQLSIILLYLLSAEHFGVVG